MNIGLIFAGGTGSRMNSKDKPKQFLEVHGKPIIIHTIDLFEETEEVDAVVVVILSDYLDYMTELVKKFNLKKLKQLYQVEKQDNYQYLTVLKRQKNIRRQRICCFDT